MVLAQKAVLGCSLAERSTTLPRTCKRPRTRAHFAFATTLPGIDDRHVEVVVVQLSAHHRLLQRLSHRESGAEVHRGPLFVGQPSPNHWPGQWPIAVAIRSGIVHATRGGRPKVDILLIHMLHHLLALLAALATRMWRLVAVLATVST